MKTLLRLVALLSLIALIGVGFYFLFQTPSLQSRLSFGRGRLGDDATRGFFLHEDGEKSWPVRGQERGFGENRGELNRGFGAGSEEFEHRVPSFAAWLGVFGTLLRLAIPMAIVIGIIKLVRWMERRSKPQRIMKGENARS